MLITNEKKLNETINNYEKNLIFFSADWCGPCKIFKPTLAKIEESFSETLNFIRVDISDMEETTTKYNILNLPTCILIKSGNEIGRFSGVKTEQQIKTFLFELLEN